MAVISSLKTATTTLRTTPTIFAAVLVLILANQVSVYANVTSPILGLLVYAVILFVAPFVYGGVIGMAAEGLSRPSGFVVFRREATENYLSMLGATLLLAVVMFGVGIVVTFVAMMVFVFVGVGAAGAGASMATLGAIGLVMFGLIFLVFGLLYLFVQFYAHAIVVDDAGVIGGFSRSVRVAIGNFPSVLGFTVVFWLVALLGTGPGLALQYLATDAAMETVTSWPLMAGSSVAYLTFGTVGSALALTYGVAFYVDVTGGTRADPTTPSDAERPDDQTYART